jgi:flagellar basal-body rod protein FlgG
LLEGMYSAAAGMAAQQARIDAVANDLANVSTTGYKHARVAFRDLIYTQAVRGAAPGVQTGAGAAATYIGRSDQQGPHIVTERSLDVALRGPGYLQVRLPDGRIALTRDGALKMDSRGRLGLATGELLWPTVRVPEGTNPERISIADDGTVFAGNRRVGRVRIVEVPAPGALAGGPNNTFLVTQASGPARAARNTDLVQGALEGSNVDMATAMAQMIEGQRAFEMASRAIQTQDQLLRIANEVKR